MGAAKAGRLHAMTHLLGVDTGGTFTDAVVWCDETERVLGSAKAPTTHDDLAVGIGAAIDAAMADAEVRAGSIGLVSLSTTLATNALVEGKGRRACLVLIGFDDDALDRSGLREALGDDALIVATGGHTSHGDEADPLDMDSILQAVDDVSDDVEAFAVTSQFSVRNPSHEIAIRDEIQRRCDRPVTCSHELSAALNGPKRGVTALLNARLVALIEELLAAADAMLAERAIDAPVMIVRGNGSLVSTDFVRGRPIETILSGPAASLLGAARLADAADAVVSDIGGTTTDVAVVTDGRPRPAPDGAVVGGHQTMVEAVEMRTHGLGGDSEVRLRDRAVGPDLELGPQRVVPVSRLAEAHDDLVIQALTRQRAADIVGEFEAMFAWRAPRPPRGVTTGRSDAGLVERLGDQPTPVDRLIRSRVDAGALRRLAAKGLVRIAAVTPTDAAHVLGHLDGAQARAAELACAVFARKKDRYGEPIAPDAATMAQVIVDTVVRRTAEVLLEAALAHDGLPVEAVHSELVSAALTGHAGAARVDIGVNRPVVALGASAATYYPAAAALLGTAAHVSELAPVANALGAAVGQVRQEVGILVSAPRRGVFRIHTGDEPETLYDLDEARARADEVASERAEAIARASGAVDITVELRWEHRSAMVDDKEYFVEGTATATASGPPEMKTAGV